MIIYLLNLIYIFNSMGFAFQGGVGKQFRSANDIVEECNVLIKIPKGDYSKKDYEKETKLCEIDFSDSQNALCPKTWNSSPATIIYDLSKSTYDAYSYELSQYCSQYDRPNEIKKKAKFKVTMNQIDTSATFSASPLLYYHFSRFFDTKVSVPVAVYREMDSNVHLNRVTEVGVKNGEEGMNKAAWMHLKEAEILKTNTAYNPISDIFTQDLTKIYGVLVDDKGTPYRNELNGTRQKKWGIEQNFEMQHTAPFIALKSPLSFNEAVDNSIIEANKDKLMAKDLVNVSSLQMIYWMRELIEISLLDFILNQQDRIENIDYEWYWYYVKEGKVEKEKEKRSEYDYLAREFMDDIPSPEELKNYNPTLIQRSLINDNDAGGRVEYTNFTKESKMLDNIYHYSADIFKKLMKLDNDFKSKGPIYEWLKSSFTLDQEQLDLIIKNTNEAAIKLKQQCKQITFDLDKPDDYLIKGVVIKAVDCSQYPL
jgi:hypothetical protein